MELDTCITKWPSRKSGMKVPPTKGRTAKCGDDQGDDDPGREFEMPADAVYGVRLPGLQPFQPAGLFANIMSLATAEHIARAWRSSRRVTRRSRQK